MLKLSEIRSFFPDSLHGYPRFMLREYLQYKILEAIFESRYANSLCLMGGTCLRIVHGNRRFSEDLDFDNTGLGDREFKQIGDEIAVRLEREGYAVEIRTVMKGASHCHIRFPGLLFEEGLSGYREEKVLIQLDAEPQGYHYQPDRIILNRFEVFTAVLAVPLPVLLSQKCFTILNRRRKMGRDFYDVVFLLAKGAVPDFAYLKNKAGISDWDTLKERILSVCGSLDMKSLADEVEPFLFDPGEKKKVIRFEEVFRQWSA